MQISLSKLAGVVTGAVVIGITGYALYFLFTVFFKGPQVNASSVITEESLAVFGPKLQKAAGAIVDPSQKISLSKKDLQFLEKNLYKSFTELPSTVPLSESRGRPDPFVPYVAP